MALVPFPRRTDEPATDDDLDPGEDGQQDADAAGKMSFLEHLDDLRRRLIWSVVSIGVGFLIAFYFIDPIFDFIMRPMQQMLPAGQTLVYTDPSEAFMLMVKIALIAGMLIASPLVFLQVWMFIAPGLYASEKKLAIPFILMSSVFFVLGVLALRRVPNRLALLRRLHE
jgi:sec-independent protein translocase protein TatC